MLSVRSGLYRLAFTLGSGRADDSASIEAEGPWGYGDAVVVNITLRYGVCECQIGVRCCPLMSRTALTSVLLLGFTVSSSMPKRICN